MRCKRPHFWMINLIGVIVPRRLRADWRQEWEAELQYRERLLAEWETLNGRTKLDLLWHSAGAFWDALWLQPRRVEDEMVQDLRFGVRMLLKHRGFTLAAVLCLALGIGANTTIFSLASALLLRPTSGTEPERLVAFSCGNRQAPLSYPDFVTLRDHNQTLSGLAILYEPMPMSFGDGDRSGLVYGEVVSGNYFEVLGIRPSLGRMFLPEEDRVPGAAPVAVVSHHLWQNRLGGDPALIGKTITLNGHRFTVVGVAAAGFIGPFVMAAVDLWVPAMMLERAVPGHRLGLNDRGLESWEAIGRLKPEVSLAQAQTELETINRQIEQAEPPLAGARSNPNEDRSLKLTRPQGIPLPHLRRIAALMTTLLAAVVGIVLLIACANVANLLLARASVRRKEIAIRLAMGASRIRLIRQLLTESLLLAFLGACAGLVLAFWLNRILMGFRPSSSSPWTFSLDLQLDAQVLAFTLLLTLLTGLVFGLAPALQASKPDLICALKNETDSAGARWRRFNLRSGLVVAQVAISLVLLLSAGLFVRSLQRLQTIDPGFKIENGLALSFRLQLAGYDETRGASFMQQLVERVAALPGVEAASIVNFVPLGFEDLDTGMTTPGKEGRVENAKLQKIGLSFFRTMGMSLVAGRDFTAQDSRTAPRVAIINEALAERLFPGERALGKQLKGPDQGGVAYEVVGIAKDTAFRHLGEDPKPVVYRPFAQSYSPRMNLVARTAGDPEALFSAVRREVQALD